jgi:hypothetical protein
MGNTGAEYVPGQMRAAELVKFGGWQLNVM